MQVTLIFGALAFVGGLILIGYLISRAKSGRQNSHPSGGSPSSGTGIRTRSPTAPTAPSGRSPPARWVGTAETVKFGNIELTGGLFYYGDWVPVAGDGTRKYAINPRLPFSGAADIEGRSMPHWPSYADISPPARRAFLDWMAGGRRIPLRRWACVPIFLRPGAPFVRGGGRRRASPRA